MAHAIRANTVIANIAADTMKAIDKQYPRDREEEGGRDRAAVDHGQMPARDETWRAVTGDRSGFLLDVDDDSLLDAAHRLHLLIEIVPSVGDFVARSVPIAYVNTEPPDELADAIRGAMSFGTERTMRRDPAFGFRQLADVGIRALSPGTNDPTTAAHVVDRVHALLLELAHRPFPNPLRMDRGGVARLRLSARTWDDYIRLATEELVIYGRGHIQVMSAVEAMLTSLAASVPEDRRRPVFAALNRLPATGVDRTPSATPDPA
jgi:uncharacterized membrane protein